MSQIKTFADVYDRKKQHLKMNHHVIVVLKKPVSVVKASFSYIGINIDLGPLPWLLACSMLALEFFILILILKSSIESHKCCFSPAGDVCERERPENQFCCNLSQKKDAKLARGDTGVATLIASEPTSHVSENSSYGIPQH